MPDAQEMAPLIHGLGAPDPTERERAAREIFRRGRELARMAMEKWLADAELTSTLVVRDSQFPETTVGVAVEPRTFDFIRIANGEPRLADVPPDQDAKEFELQFEKGVRLDILTTQLPGGGGAIARFLQRFGEGIQQVELLARDVDQATQILRKRFGLEAIYPETRAGADETRVNFFLAATAQGKKVLVELVEPRSASPH